MGLSMAERIEMALAGETTVFGDPSGGLPEGVYMNDLTGAIMAAGRDAGLSSLEVDVLFFLVTAAKDLAGWRGAHPAPAVQVPAAWIAEYFHVEPRLIREAERGLADKGWIDLGADGTGAVDLLPLLSHWETLCHLVVANLAVRRAAAHLRRGIAWRAAGLGRECGEEEVPAGSDFATLAERVVECDRLLLALEVLVAARPAADDDTQRPGAAGTA